MYKFLIGLVTFLGISTGTATLMAPREVPMDRVIYIAPGIVPKHPAPLVANAGPDQTIPDSIAQFTILDGTPSGGTAPYTIAWRVLTKPNGNSWCANIMNPTSSHTEVIYTAIFSSPFRTAYTYEYTVIDNLGAIAKDTVQVNVTYSMPAPITIASGAPAGWKYCTAADSIAIDATYGIVGRASPFRKDVLIGASTDAYAANGTKKSAFDLRNLFSVHKGTRVFIYGDTTTTGPSSAYYYAVLGMHKDSIFATRDDPWYLVPLGKVEWFSNFRFLGLWKNCRIFGGYDPVLKLGMPQFAGHRKSYDFSTGTYGFFANNNDRDQDAAGFDFNGADSMHDVRISFCETNGNGIGLAIGNTTNSVPIQRDTIDNNYFHDSRTETMYVGRTQSDPQEELDSFVVFNNRIIRGGLECDQLGQNGQGNWFYNNVYAWSGCNWISPFAENQSFNAQRYWRKNGNLEEGNIHIGASEQIRSDIANKPATVTLTNDTNFVRRTLLGGMRGTKDIYAATSNTGAFNMVWDSVYAGFRHFRADDVYNPGTLGTNLIYTILTQQNFPGTPMTFTFKHYRYDTTGGKRKLDAASTSSFYLDTARVNSLVPPRFANTGFDDSTNICPWNFYVWCDTIYHTFNNESNSGSIKYNQPWTVKAGEMVKHMGRFYLCKVTNQGHPPEGIEDTYWHPMTWTRKDGSISKRPPDNWQLLATDFYAQQRIGLIDQVATTTKLKYIMRFTP